MKKKVLFRIKSMDMGGVPKVLINILQNIAPERFECFVLMDIFQGELRESIPGNIKVFSLAGGREDMSSVKPVFLLQLLKRHIKLRLFEFFPGLIRSKIDIVPDIEIAIMHSSLPGLMRSPFTNAAKINWFHTDMRFHHTVSFGKKVAAMMNKCDVTVFVSEATQQSLEEYLNVKVRNGVCIYNAINEHEIIAKSLLPAFEDHERNIFNRKNLFVSVGRLVFQKGYDVLLEAHAELIKEGVNHHIAIAGSGPDRKKLEDRIRSLGVGNTFFLLGNKNNPYPYLKAADFYIQPSRYEAYPISLGEAMILNKPIISTKAGGVSEFLEHGNTAHLVDFDKKSLKKAIRKFIFDPDYVEHIRSMQKAFDCSDYNNEIYKKVNAVLDAYVTMDNNS